MCLPVVEMCLNDVSSSGNEENEEAESTVTRKIPRASDAQVRTGPFPLALPVMCIRNARCNTSSQSSVEIINATASVGIGDKERNVLSTN